MNVKNTYIKIGIVGKTHGYDGSLKIFLDSQFENTDLHPQFIFIDHSKKPVPYRVETCERVQDNYLLLKLEDINAKEKAQDLQNKTVSVERTDLPEQKAYDTQSLVGFSIIDQNDNFIGTIKEISSNGAHYLLHCAENSELLIPLHEELLIRINNQNQQVKITIPEGLINETNGKF